MKPIEQDIKNLKGHHAQMWELVESQIKKAILAFETNNKELAREIITREKTVNMQELVVDHHCENFIALFNPVAIDLRFVISLLKINNNLERIGDYAEGIATYVLNHQERPFDKGLCADLHLKVMMDTTVQMIETARTSLIKEDSNMACRVLGMDEKVDDINKMAIPILAKYVAENPLQAADFLHLHAVIRRVERIGDRIKNIAEDIVFYVDAKELRHKSN